jgi:hypothetical protein
MSLAELTLLPACLFVSAALVLVSSVPFQPLISYHYMRAFSDARSLRLLVANPDSPLGRASIAEVNAWFSRSLSRDHPLHEWGADYHSVDPWGNPYVCLRQPEHDEDGLLPRQVYSNGRDGLSNSGGNDPDDLNSWDDGSPDFYRNENGNKARQTWVLKSLLVLPLVFPCCIYIKRRLLGNPFGVLHNG